MVSHYTTLPTITSWIKGKAGTKVKLIIQRDNKIFDVQVERAHIEIPTIKTNFEDNNNCIIQITSFDNNVANKFISAIQQSENKKCKKYIFDLRDDPGGNLTEVAKILDHFVPKGKDIVTIQNKTHSQDFISEGNKPMLNNKKIVILINKASASASEIFAGVTKEYGEHVAII
ncbi:MAG: hypothetical protein GXP45_00775 [bacterium]|nr:hypothetical protein [bacterium]